MLNTSFGRQEQHVVFLHAHRGQGGTLFSEDVAVPCENLVGRGDPCLRTRDQQIQPAATSLRTGCGMIRLSRLGTNLRFEQGRGIFQFHVAAQIQRKRVSSRLHKDQQFHLVCSELAPDGSRTCKMGKVEVAGQQCPSLRTVDREMCKLREISTPFVGTLR